jgi:tRNA(fMet)-specific endonuclease VapC
VRYLLDTTVVSDFTRGVPPVLARLKATRKGDTAICTVTAMEIEYGLMFNPARARKIEPMIRSLLQDLHVSWKIGERDEHFWCARIIQWASHDSSVIVSAFRCSAERRSRCGADIDDDENGNGNQRINSRDVG